MTLLLDHPVGFRRKTLLALKRPCLEETRAAPVEAAFQRCSLQSIPLTERWMTSIST